MCTKFLGDGLCCGPDCYEETVDLTLYCTDCGTPVGDIRDRNVPVRCRPCQTKREAVG